MRVGVGEEGWGCDVNEGGGRPVYSQQWLCRGKGGGQISTLGLARLDLTAQVISYSMIDWLLTLLKLTREEQHFRVRGDSF